MRKLLVATAVSVIVAFSAMAPTSVAGATPLGQIRQITVPFNGSSVFDLSTPACPFVHQVFDATLGSKHDPATMHLDGCVTLATPFTFSGTFTITRPHRGHLSGTVDGTIGSTAPPTCASGKSGASLDFVLTPTSATRHLPRISSTLHLVGTWCSSEIANDPGPISGTLTGTRVVNRAHR